MNHFLTLDASMSSPLYLEINPHERRTRIHSVLRARSFDFSRRIINASGVSIHAGYLHGD